PAIKFGVDAAHLRQPHPMRQAASSEYRYPFPLGPALDRLADERSDLGATLKTRHWRSKRINYDRDNGDVPVRRQIRKRDDLGVIKRQVGGRGEVYAVFQSF